jgi:hypothetical protein
VVSDIVSRGDWAARSRMLSGPGSVGNGGRSCSQRIAQFQRADASQKLVEESLPSITALHGIGASDASRIRAGAGRSSPLVPRTQLPRSRSSHAGGSTGSRQAEMASSASLAKKGSMVAAEFAGRAFGDLAAHGLDGAKNRHRPGVALNNLVSQDDTLRSAQRLGLNVPQYAPTDFAGSMCLLPLAPWRSMGLGSTPRLGPALDRNAGYAQGIAWDNPHESGVLPNVLAAVSSANTNDTGVFNEAPNPPLPDATLLIAALDSIIWVSIVSEGLDSAAGGIVTKRGRPES